MNNPITESLHFDELIRLALKEDISNEDISTNAVMPEYKKGTVDLLAKQNGVICGLYVFARTDGFRVHVRNESEGGKSLRVSGNLRVNVTVFVRIGVVYA